MRVSWWISIAFFASSVLSIESLPFSAPKYAEANDKRAFEVLQLLKRADNCPPGYNSCDSGACCQSGTTCTKDGANNIACCRNGATCTGTLSATAASSGSSFMFPQSTTATATADFSISTGAGITGSTITGAAYPFVAIPTTFPNAATCSSYYTLCENQYTSCTSLLAGRYGVTVAGGGAGVTVGGAGPSAAVSVCSSLSLNACHGLNIGYCAAYGTAAATDNAAVPRQSTSFQDLVLGVVVGVAGILI